MDEYRDLNDDYPGAGTFRFGEGAKQCRKLTDLVIAGGKTATCAALRDFADDPESRPVVGRRDIACAWDGTPRVVIETTEVLEVSFDAVTEDFARVEGAGSLAEWRGLQIAQHRRAGGWSNDMMLLCERFRVVEVLE